MRIINSGGACDVHHRNLGLLSRPWALLPRADRCLARRAGGRSPMRVEPSKLVRLVIAYHEKFGRHVPAPALRLLNAGDLAAILQDSLATGVPLLETGWGRASSIEFSPRGCIVIVDDENAERAMPTKGPDGEWLHSR